MASIIVRPPFPPLSSRESRAVAAGGLRVAALALAVACAAVAGLGTPPGAREQGRHAGALAQGLIPNPAAAPGASPGGQDGAHATITYGSWGSGFVADAPAGEAFTSLSARFVAPAAPEAGASGWVAIWGGIGLAAPAGDELMQAGVSMYSAGGGAWQASVPWWINEPRTPTEPHVMSVTIRPGDTVEVDLGRAASGQWAFRVTDLTTGGVAEGACSGCHSDGQTAAWIVEDPTSSSGSGQTGFADPGTVDFLEASASLDSAPGQPLGDLAWQPLLRTAGGSGQAPEGAPGARGAFQVVDVAGPQAGGA